MWTKEQGRHLTLNEYDDDDDDDDNDDDEVNFNRISNFLITKFAQLA